MIGKLLTCALSLALVASPARAQWVVTDPGSYAYYVEQINQQVQMVEKAAKQVETMGGVLTEAQKIQKNLMGHYNRAVSLVNRVNRLTRLIGREPSGGIIGEAKKWGNVGRQVGGVMRSTADGTGRVIKDVNSITGDDAYYEMKEVLDEVFTDPRDISDPAERTRSLSRRYQLQQGALKEVVARSERTLSGIKERIDVVKELADMIDKTENQKDAQDLTNRILVEVLSTLTDLLAVAAQTNQAEALFKFRGANSGEMEKRSKILNAANDSASKLEETLKSANSNYRTFE